MTNTSTWIEFHDDSPAARRKYPRVALTKGRHFRFNQKAIELIGSPKAVRFLFDVQLNRIGVRPADPEAPYAFKVRRESECHSSIVLGAAFCDSLNIRPEHTLEFQSVRVDDQGTLLLDLSTAKRSIVRTRGRRSVTT